ncbi:MAG: FAD-dependent oxidoreductase [Waddliaceae bacterium]
MRPKIAVVGAGISGLVCAYQLQKKGADVSVFEKEALPGGRMSCLEKNGLCYDAGANFFVDNYKTLKGYCRELGIDEKWQPLRNGQIYGFSEGEIHPLSLSLNTLIFYLRPVPFVQRLKLLYLLHSLANTPLEGTFYNLTELTSLDQTNAYDYVLQHVGKQAADHVIDSFTSTYQFHGAKEISLAAMVGLIREMVEHNAEFAAYQTVGGMRQIPMALAEKLNCTFNCEVHEVVSQANGVVVKSDQGDLLYDTVVLATTANVTRKILRDPTEKQIEFLSQVRYAPTIMVSFIVPEELMKDIYLVMVPFVESRKICIYSNEGVKGKHFQKEGHSVVNAALHSSYAEKIFTDSDEIIFDKVKEELKRLCPYLKECGSIQNHLLTRWKTAMPVFSHGYLSQVEKFLNDGQGERGVFLCGDYLNSPWTEGSARCGERVADALYSLQMQLPRL